jgi:polyisoprenoid-binding protein YceI
MRIPTVVLLACLAGLTSAMAGWRGECVSDFAVKATMDSFTGHATSKTFAVSDDDADVQVEVAVDTMKTGKGKRDKEMIHMFHAEEFPTIVGTVPAAALRELKAGGTETNDLPFSLAMHGITNQLVAKVSAVADEDNKRSLDAAFDVSLKEFGLKPPSILGMIKVNDKVRIVSHISLTAEGQPPQQ